MSHTTVERPQGALGNTRLDLPAEAYQTGSTTTTFPARGKYNSSGKPAIVRINHFKIDSIKTKTIWQYDVSGRFLGKREPRNIDALISKAWKTDACKKVLESHKSKWLYDGRKLAWSTVKVDFTFRVDLDNNKNPDNAVEIHLRPTVQVDLSRIASYVNGQSDMNNGVLESINFLDHLIRQYPSENSQAIRRSFYSLKARPVELSSFVDCVKGTYASVRLNQTAGKGGLGVGVNVDVANTAFWKEGLNLIQLAEIFSAYTTGKTCTYTSLRPVPAANDSWGRSDDFMALVDLKNISFYCPHQKKAGIDIVHKLGGFAHDSQYGAEGCTSKTMKIMYQEREMTIERFIEKKYSFKLKNAEWPLVETSRRGTFFPAELCVVLPLQRYPHKLDAYMTSQMIKTAVTPPGERMSAITNGCNALKWNTDPYLQHFGVKINNSFVETQARVLAPPELQYAAGKCTNPGTSGRWMCRNEHFFKSSMRPVKHWAVVMEGGSSVLDATHRFMRMLSEVYRSHGGDINPDYQFYRVSGNIPGIFRECADLFDVKNPVEYVYYVSNEKSARHYEQIKKFFDCKAGFLSQVLLASQVKKLSQQYMSNVCLKMNAKLGGISWIAGRSPNLEPGTKAVSMFIGVDVSHSPVGMEIPSMASMTMSFDRHVARYGAAVETNGFRREMLTAENVKTLLGRLYGHWTAPCAPTNIYYLRDGVSEGQFQHVLDEEVPQMKAFFRSQGCNPKFTVVIATKRHHIRFFPTNNSPQCKGNPLPGTLVEREVTHPRQFDFYLCSHAAIKGTARPVHYHVIMDEAKCNPEKLQKMLYDQCYQYIRSTTPVSLHPAVYYAHLASNRARAHESHNSSNGQLAKLGGSPAKSVVFHRTMWYI